MGAGGQAIVLAGILAAGCLAPTATATESRKAAPRHVSDTYVAPAVIVPGVEACAPKKALAGLANIGCIDFDVRLNERFVKIEIEDASGLPAPARVTQEYGSHGGLVCGATKRPMRIARGVPISIWLKPYAASPLCPGASTSGTVHVTFLKRRR